MKNIKLLIITFLFSSLLAACGMKGPLYRAPAAVEPATADTEQQQVQTEQATSESRQENQ